ncbi:Smr/MutS family protein [Yunchengibacter salinarum]|uniref:Smr/MutS family protein n=1 Tax=Yunchengibacter salinarum TaxID=3133399 RepID=UPI0035B6006D
MAGKRRAARKVGRKLDAVDTNRRRGTLSAADRALWEAATSDVAPLTDRPVAPEPPRPPRRAAPRPASDPPPRPGAMALDPQDRLDRRTRRRLTRGDMAVDRVVDLHGHTQTDAHDRLRQALMAAVAAGEKTLVVITGKGGRRYRQSGAVSAAYRRRADFDTHGGVLKRLVPEWLAAPELAPYVDRYATASQNHGGDGALYVLLRRRREPRS